MEFYIKVQVMICTHSSIWFLPLIVLSLQRDITGHTCLLTQCNLLVTKAYTLKIQKKTKVVHIYKKRRITTDKVYKL